MDDLGKTPANRSRRVRFYVDETGQALERLLGDRVPALWMRPRTRIAESSEVVLLRAACNPASRWLFWRARRARDSDASRAFEGLPGLVERVVGGLDVLARTALGGADVPSHLDMSDGTDVDSSEIERFVSDTSFGLLSGIIFGTPERAPALLRLLAPLLRDWDKTTREDGERALRQFVLDARRRSTVPILMIVDSDLQTYWVAPREGDDLRLVSVHENSAATDAEFESWARRGWDARFLQRPAAASERL